MPPQRPFHCQEGELPPTDVVRRIPTRRPEQFKPPRRVVRMKRLARQDPALEAITTRNRLIIQEMRMVYNQLTGVGDQLLDYKLAGMSRGPRGLGTLGRMELSALNYDLANLASSIFGNGVAKAAYDRVASAITHAFS